ncbi:KIF-binding protein-like isoform X1 [Anthonomus grandis grandis]|uniref:KIF-binding protein-like isoform X1 n=1 Tax=Anthonomus grandis grandis TaxID=2921223 RepID=UPI002164FCCA|nr:KIF-binding protein-like isoform X1 [Anthonomus grandis grandis]
MDEESPLTGDLQACFNELKKHSVSYKLGQTQETAGDEIQNPLHKQFSLILAKIDEVLANQNKESEEFLKIISMKASIIYEKAKILLSENLLPECRDFLKESLDLIKGHSDHPKIAFLHMRIVNHLTYVLSRLGSLDEAEEMLVKAIDEEKKCTPEVYSTDDLFLNTKKDEKMSASKLNRLSLNNMQMLAWIYARLGNAEANLRLQHAILQKQLNMEEFHPIKWAESCFRLAGMFVTNGDWENALYHLFASEMILSPLLASLIPNPDAYAAEADLARSWIYYGLQLFEASRKPMILKDIEGDEVETEVPDEVLPSYTFNGLDVVVSKEIPCGKIISIEQAKNLFDHVQKWVKRARLFYTLRDFPLQYVNLCLDLSELFRFLGFFEKDLESQYAVQKRRYDSLEALSNILREVRPSCYVAVNVELTKELIEVQMELMNLNLKKLYTPAKELRLGVNEESVRRQMTAFSSLHETLEKVSSSLNVPAKSVESSEPVPQQ